jgi:hypothetical protein
MVLALTEAQATIIAAGIVAIVGGIVAGFFAYLSDRQEKETRWRDQAIELTKLDLERKLRTRAPGDTSRIRPSILDFLANYRDLCELRDNSNPLFGDVDGDARRTPTELYELIRTRRTASAKRAAGEAASASDDEASDRSDS